MPGPSGASTSYQHDEPDYYERSDSSDASVSDYEEDASSTSEEVSDAADEDEDALGADEARTEAAIEGDFDRLVQNIREGGAASGPGLLSKDWDFDLEEKEAEFRDDLRAASGVGRAKGKKKRGRRAGPVLSQQVKALIGEGNQAYVDNDLAGAMRVMQEVIRIEPRAASAWSVLAQCHADRGEPQRALQLRIMGAHLLHDAEEWERLARQSLEMGHDKEALYCFGKVTSLDPTNVNALWDRATLAKSTGELRTARNAFLTLLKRLPHNLTVLDELRPVLIELSELPLCAQLFADAFAYYHGAFPGGSGVDPFAADVGAAEVPGGGFGALHLLVLADLHNTLGAHAAAVHAIRRGCRWLQGRAAQRFWDACEDDREFDGAEGRPRAEGEMPPGTYPLDVNARHRLAIARIKMGDIEEGKRHANIILAQEVVEYAPLFAEIADAYYEREMYAEAGHIYEILGADAGTSSLHVILQAAACRRMIGNLDESAEMYEHVIAADPTHNEAKMKLAEIYEILGNPRRALDLVLQVIDSRKRRSRQDASGEGTPDPSGTLLFEDKARGKGKAAQAKPANRLTHAQLRELEAQQERETAASFRRVRELWPRMLAGETEAEREWLVEAEKLVESFRETRNLFLASRQLGFRGMFPRSSRKQITEQSEDSMASRLQLEIGLEGSSRKIKSEGTKGERLNAFRTISFDDWLRLFMQYAFLLTKRGQYDHAQEILRHILFSNAYQGSSDKDTIHLTLMACSIHARKFNVVVDSARKLVSAHQFNNEPLRVLLASLGSGLQATDAFLVSTLSKHLLRELKVADAVVKNRDAVRWNTTLKRYGLPGGSSKADEGDDALDDEPVGTKDDSTGAGAFVPTKDNPISVALYGQLCLASRSYQSALFYLLHAYDYCPHDPMICLCLAIASFGRAMQRQADNRHHLVAQGTAFLSQYRKLRGADDVDMDEVEYNFGRAFHQLGLYTHAVRHYERVLEMAEARLKTGSQAYGLAREAAYNLSQIYVTTGATPLAQELYRRWLSI
ncbi:hypothetical protein CERSUDRAFT_145423 [Gelatoporia subvermispora B]|uniref:TPR-like protein n=1 Tax=Ceriporiopsis subvermispora (strain B) TaxID=914234 RepID=M2QXK6_CERS8|nr:hypothetical protein CERSUDRAFT_145423 [Gelatoporia subvermispora B]